VLAINANALTMQADLKLKNARVTKFAGAGDSALAKFSATGLGVIHARIAKSELPTVVMQLVRTFPGSASLSPVAKEVAPLLTGNTAVLLSHAKVSGGLKSKEARFFALRFALVAEAADVDAVKVALAKLDARSLMFSSGTLTVTVSDRFVVVANDDDVRQRAVAALSSASGKQAHGLDFSFEPKLVARALQQIPLWEAMQSAELAGFVAASAELGPLLLASARINGWVDSLAGAVLAGRLNWELDSSVFPTDVAPASGTQQRIE
jgi:hypothetical protein